jgi:hypothetical protein
MWYAADKVKTQLYVAYFLRNFSDFVIIRFSAKKFLDTNKVSLFKYPLH